MSAEGQPSGPTASQASVGDQADTVPGGKQTTRISRRWLIKMAVIAGALLIFGFWGLYDALVAYPNRGALAAERAELDYLEQYVEYRNSSPLARREPGIDDPAAELARLEEADAARARTEAAAPIDETLERWLTQLRFIGKLDGPTATDIPRTDFRGVEVPALEARIDQLRQKWKTTDGGLKKSNPLSRFDIPSQWLITAVGFIGGAWIIALVARVSAKSYGWEPAHQRLHLPGGASVTPGDLEEIDKTLWHKFYVDLVVKPHHPQLGGKSVRLDLMRYEPLEQWVLEMERTIDPEAANAAAASPTAEAAPEAEPA